VEACRTLCGDARIGASTPIVILLRDPATREQRLAGLRAGAWECVGLPLDTEELLLKLDAYVRAKSHADAAREESLVDEASGLYNLRGLLRRIREMGGEACRHRRPLACVVFALDGGEADAAGRGAGARARAAQAVPRLLGLFQDAARSSDVVGRLGETEFVVLAPGTDAAGALQLARRLLAAAEAVDAERKGAPTLRLRAGCHAVADFCNAGIEPVEMLVRAAQALRALPTGREAERIRFFPSPGRAVAR
jgi:diguanylate cyclase (GGDEF)-like protein